MSRWPVTFRQLLPGSRVVQAFGLIFGALVWLFGAGVSVVVGLVTVLVSLAVCIWGYLTMRAVSPSLDLRRDLPLWLAGPCFGFGLMSLLVLRVVLPREGFLWAFVLVPLLFVLPKGVKWVRQNSRGKVEVFGDREHLLFAFVVTGLAGLSLASWWSWSLPITLVALVASALIAGANLRTLLLRWLLVVPMLLAVWWMSETRPTTWWLRAAGIPTDESQLEAYSNALVEFGPLTNPLWHGYDGLTATAYHHLSYLFVGLINVLASAKPYTVQHLVAPAVFAVSLVASLLLFIRQLISRLESVPKLNGLTLAGLLACMTFLRIESAPSTQLGPTVLLASFVMIAKVNEHPASWRNAALIGVSVLATTFAKGPLATATVGAAVVYALLDIRARWKIALATVVSFVAITAYFWLASTADSILRFSFWPSETLYSKFGISLYHLKVFLTFVVVPVAVGLACLVICLFAKTTKLYQWTIALGSVFVGSALSQVILVSDGDKGHRYFVMPAYTASGLLILIGSLAFNDALRLRFTSYLTQIAVSLGVFQVLNLVNSSSRQELVSPVPITAAIAVLIAAFGLLEKFWPALPIRRLQLRAGVLAMLFLVSGFMSATVRTDLSNLRLSSANNAGRSWSNWYGDQDMVELAEFILSYTTRSNLLAISTCDLKVLPKDYCDPDFRIAALTGRRFLASEARISFVDPRIRTDVMLSNPIEKGQSRQVIKNLKQRGVDYFILLKARAADHGREFQDLTPERILFANNTYLVIRIGDESS